MAAARLGVGDVVGELDRLALDGAVAEHDDDRGQRRRQADELHRAHGDGLGPRADDDGGVVGELGEQVGVRWSISSSRPWAVAKNSPTCAVVRCVEPARRR